MGLLNNNKKKPISERREELIKQGEKFKFQTIAKHTDFGSFAKPSNELFAWVTEVENYLEENYGPESAPYRQFDRYNRDDLSGSMESKFNKQIDIIKGSLYACRNINPSKKKNKKTPENNEILSLLNNKYFYITIVVLIGGAFSLGILIGGSKFDSEKNDLYSNNKLLKDTVQMQKTEIVKYKDSIKKLSPISAHRK